MCRQNLFCGGESRTAGAEIDRGIVILDALSDGGRDLLSKLTRGNALALGAVAQESTLDQDAGNLDIS
jgi:hypothetical protein